MIYNREFETMPLPVLRAHQSALLVRLVHRVYERVPFYRAKMDAAGVKPADIRSIDDIALLPFTNKDEMRQVFPYGLLACDQADIVEIHASTGTTGKPIVSAYTQHDLEIWSEVMARSLTMSGVMRHDVVQNAAGYGLFTGGLGVHYGAQKIGAMVIPASVGNTRRQIEMMRHLGTTVLASTSSYVLHLAEVGREEGFDFSQSKLRVGFFGAEPWSESMRAEIQEKLGIKAFDNYGLTEVIGPGVAAECELQDHLHIFEDHFYPEVIDPATGAVLPPSERGELVLTTLTKEGAPVIRYRTRDITYLSRESCPCGRTSVRMQRVLGRTDDMLIVRGVNIFPMQIEQALLCIDGIAPHYQILVDRQDHRDYIEVQAEMSDSLFSDSPKAIGAKEREIAEALRLTLLISAKVKLVEPRSITRSEGKARRVIDKRHL